MKKIIKKGLFDVAMAAILVLSLWITGYLIPEKGVKAQTVSQTNLANTLETNSANLATLQDKLSQMQSSYTPDYRVTNVNLSTEDWSKKYADKFSDTIIANNTTYKSPNVSIELSHHSLDSGVLDTTNEGKHTKYGTKIAYVVADIYVSDITCLQTAFAQDTYGVGFTEKLSTMSARMNSILSVNGDSYSNNRHKDNGTIIRNGVIYRAQSTDMETCVLNWDGTMKIYNPGEVNTQNLIDSGAYQSWIFGPSLLDAQGKAKTDFLTWDYIRESHPRTAIGYYEPGHYCLIVVDGRQTDYSRGMFLDELASVFENLGCKVAYNLDGGHSSFMNMQNQMVSHPYKTEHQIQDGIFITEGLS